MAAAPGWKLALEQFSRVVQSLRDACTTCTGEAPTGVVTRNSWTQNADRISNLLPKFTLAFRDLPAEAMCKPLGELLIQALMDHVALLQLLCSQCGQLVAAAAKERVVHLLDAVLALSQALQLENQAAATVGTDRLAKGRVTEAFGISTNCCEELKLCPLDSHRAAAGQLQSFARLVKDAMKELAEMQQWENKEGESKEEAVEQLDDFDDLDDEQLSDEERALVQVAEQLLRGAGAMLEKVATMLIKAAASRVGELELARNTGDELVRGGDQEWAPKVVRMGLRVQESVDDLVAILYEFDKPALNDSAVALVAEMHSMQEFLATLPEYTDASERGVDMAKVVSVVNSICDGAIQQLQD